jgi:hypothetical protein
VSVAARNEERLVTCNFLWIKIALFHRRGTSYPLPHIVALIVLAECVSRSSQYRSADFLQATHRLRKRDHLNGYCQVKNLWIADFW